MTNFKLSYIFFSRAVCIHNANFSFNQSKFAKLLWKKKCIFFPPLTLKEIVMGSPDPLRVRGVGHVRPCRLLHRLLVELVFGERGWTQRTNTERWGDVDLCHGRLRRGRCARCCRWTREDICRMQKKQRLSSITQEAIAMPHFPSSVWGMVRCDS